MHRHIKRLLQYSFRDIPLWLIALLTCWLPERPWVCRVRGMLSRPFFRKCGRNFQYSMRVRFFRPENLTIGNDVYIAEGCWLNARDELTIDDEVMFGPYSMALTSNHKMENGSARFAKSTGSPVHLKRGAWLAAHSVVLAGVTVGSGCVVAANAVVTRDTPDNSIVGGVPARLIKIVDEPSPGEQQTQE